MQSHRGLYGQLAFLLLLSLALGLASPARAQTPTPLAGLERLPLIPIPTWTSGDPDTGVSATVASTDVFSFDPSTHTMYFADRTNRGVSAIDTRTNTYVGTIVVPTCTAGLNAAGAGSCPSGVLVAPDLHKLVITDRSQVIGTTTQLLNSPKGSLPRTIEDSGRASMVGRPRTKESQARARVKEERG